MVVNEFLKKLNKLSEETKNKTRYKYLLSRLSEAEKELLSIDKYIESLLEEDLINRLSKYDRTKYSTWEWMEKCKESHVDLRKVTKNGEITLDVEKGLFEVWDETYADTVCTTPYPLVAIAALKSYTETYLEN